MLAALVQCVEGGCVEEGGCIRMQSGRCVAGVQGQAGPSKLAGCRGDLPEVAGQWCQMERFIVYRMAKGHKIMGDYFVFKCHEQRN
jgi:hypothetical protein